MPKSNFPTNAGRSRKGRILTRRLDFTLEQTQYYQGITAVWDGESIC